MSAGASDSADTIHSADYALLGRLLRSAKAAHGAARHVASFGNCTHRDCRDQHAALRSLGWKGGYYQ